MHACVRVISELKSPFRLVMVVVGEGDMDRKGGGGGGGL